MMPLLSVLKVVQHNWIKAKGHGQGMRSADDSCTLLFMMLFEHFQAIIWARLSITVVMY